MSEQKYKYQHFASKAKNGDKLRVRTVPVGEEPPIQRDVTIVKRDNTLRIRGRYTIMAWNTFFEKNTPLYFTKEE